MLWCQQLALGTDPILTYIHLNGSNLQCEKRHHSCWYPWQVYPFYSLDPSKQVCHAPKGELHFYETVQQLHLARALNCNQECCQTLLRNFRREELVLRAIPCPCHLHNLTRHSYYKLPRSTWSLCEWHSSWIYSFHFLRTQMGWWGQKAQH